MTETTPAFQGIRKKPWTQESYLCDRNILFSPTVLHTYSVSDYKVSGTWRVTMAFRILMSPWNYASLHAYMGFSVGRIKLTQRVDNPQKMKNRCYRQYLLASSQQIYYFQIKWPRKADEEADFLLASKGAEFHRPKLTEMAHLRNNRRVSWRPKLWQSISARDNTGHRRGHSGKLEIYHQGLRKVQGSDCAGSVPTTMWPGPSFLVSFSSIKWWQQYHLPQML